jgi:hypothetical protein
MLRALDRLTNFLGALTTLEADTLGGLKQWTLQTLRPRLLLRTTHPREVGEDIMQFVRRINNRMNDTWLPFTHAAFDMDSSQYPSGVGALVTQEDLLFVLGANIGSARATQRQSVHRQVMDRTRRDRGSNPAAATFANNSVVAWAGEQAGHPAFVLGLDYSDGTCRLFFIFLRDERVKRLWTMLIRDHADPACLGLFAERDLKEYIQTFCMLSSVLTAGIAQAFIANVRFDGRPALFTQNHDWLYWDALLGIFGGTPYEYSSEQKQMYMSDWEEEYTFDVPNPTRAWQFRTSEKLFWVMACDTDSDPFFLVGLSNANGSFDAIIHEDNDPLFLNQHGVVYLPW